MIEVGVRDLKNQLSRYLRKVRQGETVVVTDRGDVVARLIPAGIPDHIAKLMAEGTVMWSAKRFRPPEKLIRPKPGPLASDYISEDRR